VQAPLVEPVDPGHRGELDVGQVLQRAGVEGAGADGLGLEQSDDRLHQGVVVGVADGPDRRCDPPESEVLGIPALRGSW